MPKSPGRRNSSPQLTPYTLHSTLYTLHPTPYTLHPTPYTLHPTPYTLHAGAGQPYALTSERSRETPVSILGGGPTPSNRTLSPQRLRTRRGQLKRLETEKEFKPRPESGPDCLNCAKVSSQEDLRKVERDARLDPRGGQREGVLTPRTTPYRVTSLIRNSAPPGPYSRPPLRGLGLS